MAPLRRALAACGTCFSVFAFAESDYRTRGISASPERLGHSRWKREEELAYDFFEFFAGGGMARAGLGRNWHCSFANDFDSKKARTYSENWGSEKLIVGDVRDIKTSLLPGVADLAWASFPCQDLSLAGSGGGLKGNRSGSFWPFSEIIRNLKEEARRPRLVVLENVCGALTSHDGRDFAAICDTIVNTEYRVGALVIDAVHFVPQSRPRLFIVAVRDDIEIPINLIADSASDFWHPSALRGAKLKLSPKARENWIWWRLSEPPTRNSRFTDLIEENPKGVRWHTETETKKLLNMMSDINLRKVEAAKKADAKIVGGVYKRTRPDGQGGKAQRAEVRFDDVAGCLRTPAGGSSRQTIIVVEGARVRSRLLAPREAAHLMGLPNDYRLPDRYNDAYHLVGDGVVVPVVRYLSENIIEPILNANEPPAVAA